MSVAGESGTPVGLTPRSSVKDADWMGELGLSTEAAAAKMCPVRPDINLNCTLFVAPEGMGSVTGPGVLATRQTFLVNAPLEQAGIPSSLRVIVCKMSLVFVMKVYVEYATPFRIVAGCE